MERVIYRPGTVRIGPGREVLRFFNESGSRTTNCQLLARTLLNRRIYIRRRKTFH